MMTGNLPVVPSHASLSASGRAAAPSTIRGGGSEHFFGSVHNNVARPASFSQQTAHLQQAMQQSHVNGFSAGSHLASSGFNSARGTGSTRTTGATGMGFTGMTGKPSASTFANRETSNPGNRSVGNAGSNGGMRPFTPPNNSTRISESGNGVQHGLSQSGSAASRDGFRPFTPPSNSGASRGEAGVSSERGSSGSYWNRTAPSGMESRGYGSAGSYGRGGSSRPQLDMRQPIVRGPSYGGYSRGMNNPYGGGRGVPSYGGSRGVPNYGGSRGGYGGGHVSAPSGGGHSYGGGGGHSSGGGGHSGGGGGHSGGGGHGGGGHR
jgi:hypothetical protein